jgi:hypothetical protein
LSLQNTTHQQTILPTMDNTTPDIMVLRFADSSIPVFKESKNKGYIKYGENNLYPKYLNYLFNKSAKHNAIVNGKAMYIFGAGYTNGDIIVNKLNESLNDITKKCILDTRVYGGYRLEIIWNKIGQVCEVYHVEYSTIRKGKDGGYFYKENWDISNRDEEVYIEEFNPSNRVGRQIFAYNEYRPDVRFYPLPDYIGANNYIETDIEISKYYLSAIKNGMMPSKMVQFYTGGDIPDDKKREIENRWKQKFAGSENAGKFVLVFNSNKDKSVDVQDLSGTDLDKHFVEMNKTCQQEIFSGHLVTSPMLFGIKTEGQLGGNTELQTAYTIFQNTYARPKAQDIDKEFNWLMSFSKWPAKYELQESDPLGWQIPDELLRQAITVDEVRTRLGLQVEEKRVITEMDKTLKTLGLLSPLVATKVMDNLTKNEIREIANLPPVVGGDLIPTLDGSIPTTIASPTLDTDIPQVAANDNIKNLSAKQHQQLMRIIRQYSKEQLTESAAKALLRAGLGLSEDDINSLLGIEPTAMSAIDEDTTIAMFAACGENKSDYEILKSKRVSFATDEEAFEDEFRMYQNTDKENKILDLIKKDPKITNELISKATKIPIIEVTEIVNGLVEAKLILPQITKIGIDTAINRVIAPSLKKDLSPSPVQIMIKYSYEGPQDNRNRPFCAKLMDLDRLYTRADIEKISQRLGYSVFDRRGGFWNRGSGVISEHCRHDWKSNIVVKKK